MNTFEGLGAQNSKSKENTSSENNSSSTKLFCVGIGASAGGLEALEEFFKNMPPDSDMSFIVVQHLAPDYKSLMVELLSKHTLMKVIRAEDGMQVMPNCVYLIPPKKDMTIFHHKLFLSEKVHNQAVSLPIDIFFRSLAEDFAENSIGIILSGTGSDGTLGIRAIKGAGGMVMAQNDHSAKFDGMPRSAIATGLVDFVLSVEQMPQVLLRYVNHPYKGKKELQSELPEDNNALNKIMGIIRHRIGVDFTFYKPTTIVRRLERRISINQVSSFENYVTFLEQSPNEADTLYKELLIGVTRFFRDTEAFDLLRDQIIPKLFAQKENNEPLRIWSVGCSTGEEAYSIAMLLYEYMEDNSAFCDIKIFATDLDKDSIEFGGMGYYTESIIADVSEDRLKRFFIRKPKGYQVNETIRKMVIFAAHNVIKDPPFSRISLLVCRNMLIYLKPGMQKKVLSMFHFSLTQNGYLFLGPSETLGELSKNFSTLNSKWKMFAFKEIASPESFSTYLTPQLKDGDYVIQNLNQGTEISLQQNTNYYNDAFFNAIIDEVAPPSLIVDQNFDIVHICKDINRFIKLPSGKMSLNVLSLIRNEINTPVSIALNKAVKQKKEVLYKDLVIKDNKDEFTIDLKIKPLLIKNDSRKLFLMAFLEKETSTETKSKSQKLVFEFDVNQQIQDLENDLNYTKENLQATIEELGTSNEELQSSNEELITSNEELQSTNEELQSVNEELFTVNNEYQNKIEELTLLNNDVTNLLVNTHIGTVFLDMKLNIRKFTPAVTSAINILDMDIGRPIYHISHNILYEYLIKDIEQVVRTLKPKEIEVEGKKGNWFLLRILPYRTTDNAIEGIVITFLDITQRKKHEKEIEQNAKLLISVLDNSPIASIRLDKKKTIIYANNLATELLDIPKSEITKKKIIAENLELSDEFGNPLSDDKSPFSKVIQSQKSIFEMIVTIKIKQENKIFSINGAPVFEENGQINGGIFTLINITKKKD
jgi:two-component system, chemotaxis family, CheB/CheR fusion protein